MLCEGRDATKSTRVLTHPGMRFSAGRTYSPSASAHGQAGKSVLPISHSRCTCNHLPRLNSLVSALRSPRRVLYLRWRHGLDKQHRWKNGSRTVVEFGWVTTTFQPHNIWGSLNENIGQICIGSRDAGACKRRHSKRGRLSEGRGRRRRRRALCRTPCGSRRRRWLRRGAPHR